MTKTNHNTIDPAAVKFLETFIRHKVMVQSRTDPTCWYMVDTEQRTCECIFWQKTKVECWHIEQALKFRKEKK